MEFAAEYINLKIVLMLTFAFAFASILGYLAYKIKLSPILGYLLAGYLIGPYSPGYVADLKVSEQLAEIGVILMMFGVGMHFQWSDLTSVKSIAIPGAILQTAVATLVSIYFMTSIGWSLEAGIIFGLAIGVASTVVLVRILSDNKLLHTTQGHIAVGWLIVEDIISIVALLMLPTLAESNKGAAFSYQHLAISLAVVLLKFGLLIAILFTIGKRLVTSALTKVLRTRSNELFTLTILALTFVIAIVSAMVFGTSIALGAFIAGMLMGQTTMRQQIASLAKPLRDTFIVIFFITIGMLFNPSMVTKHFWISSAVLGIILIIKPLTAFLITWIWRYPIKTALTIGLSLAQIGEFSFILSEEATRLNILPDEGYDIIVACSLVSISLNPLLMKWTKGT